MKFKLKYKQIGTKEGTIVWKLKIKNLFLSNINNNSYIGFTPWGKIMKSNSCTKQQNNINKISKFIIRRGNYPLTIQCFITELHNYHGEKSKNNRMEKFKATG